MAKALKLYFVCDKTFDALEGADALERHCGTCDRAVVNVDPLPEPVRERLAALSLEAGIGLCVAGTASADDPAAIGPCRSASAQTAPFVLPMLAGAAVPPEREAAMARERERQRVREARVARALEQKQSRAKEAIKALLDAQRARLRGEAPRGFIARLRALLS